MKKLALILAVCVSASAFSQKVLSVTLQSNVLDTHFISEDQVLKIVKTTGGSNLDYLDGKGDFSSLAIRERTLDTANVAATIQITFAGASGSVDSITINGVEIMGGSVAFTSTIATTVGLVEDSIDNTTSSPVNYSASNVGAVLTISAPAAFGDTANGYTVVVYTTTITSTFTGGSTNKMANGFTAVRNINTDSDGIFNIGDGETALQRTRVETLVEKNGGGCIIYVNDTRNPQTITSENCQTVMDAMNAK